MIKGTASEDGRDICACALHVRQDRRYQTDGRQSAREKWTQDCSHCNSPLKVQGRSNM